MFICRYLEEYLDSKRPLSPLSPLSDSPEPTETSKTKHSEQHYSHNHKSRDKNSDSAVKVLQKNKNKSFTIATPSLPRFLVLFNLFLKTSPSPRWRWNAWECQDSLMLRLSPGAPRDTEGPCPAMKRKQKHSCQVHTLRRNKAQTVVLQMHAGILFCLADSVKQLCVSHPLSRPHHAEYYLHEAKRMKHRADAMVSCESGE